MTQLAEAFDWDGDNGKTEEHDRREEEDAAEGIACCRVSKEENLGESPAEAGEEGGSDDKDESNSVECRFTGYHHDDTEGHCGNNEDKFDGRRFEAEEECEAENKG